MKRHLQPSRILSRWTFSTSSNKFPYSQQCCGSRIRLFSSWIPDPTFFILDPGSDFFHPGSEFFPPRIPIKEFKYFNRKKLFISSRKYDPGCSSRIRIRILTCYTSRIPDPGVKKTPDPGSGSATLILNNIHVQVPHRFQRIHSL
jgi:hypothetical protein